MPRNEKNVLLISSESWGHHFVSKHHYAYYLSQESQVFFLNPATGFARFPFGNMQIEASAASENLHVVSYKNLLPKIDLLPRSMQRWIYALQARKIQRFIGKKLTAIWSFDPFRFPDQLVWDASKSVYFAMDVHAKNSFEAEIAQTSDLILLVSDFLLPRFSGFGAKVHTIGHGADIQQFESPKGKVVLLGKNKVKAGLTGNFNNNVDYALIREMAVSNPDIDFIFIGPYKPSNLGNIGDKTGIVAELSQLENVFFLGSLPSGELLKYLCEFDFNLVLYKAENQDINFNPHKLMAYFYAGKAVVSSWLHEHAQSDRKLIAMAKDNAGILALISEIKNDLENWNSSENQQMRRDFAVSNSYASKVKHIQQLLHGK